MSLKAGEELRYYAVFLGDAGERVGRRVVAKERGNAGRMLRQGAAFAQQRPVTGEKVLGKGRRGRQKVAPEIRNFSLREKDAADSAREFFGDVGGAVKGVFHAAKDVREKANGFCGDVLERAVAIHGLKKPTLGKTGFG